MSSTTAAKTTSKHPQSQPRLTHTLASIALGPQTQSTCFDDLNNILLAGSVSKGGTVLPFSLKD